MAEHKHGSMDTSVQEKTYEGFIKFSVRVTIGILVALVLLTLING
jgi:hypothetical protein